MQFLIVQAKSFETGAFYTSAPVLIDSKENGVTGTTLMLNRGVYYVSVKLPGAEVKVVNLEDTTCNCPKEVTIDVLHSADMETVCISGAEVQAIASQPMAQKKKNWAQKLFAKIRSR